MKFFILGFILLLSDFVYAQTMKVEILNNGVSIPNTDVTNLLTADDIDLIFTNVEGGCVRHKADATTLQVTSLPSKNLFAFSPAMFATCTPLALGISHMKVDLTVTKSTHPLYNYTGSVTFLYSGSVNYYGNKGLNLVAPSIPSISLSGDFQLCEGQELGESRELTVMNAPEGANVRVFDGAEDVTSKFVVTGMTGLSIKPAAFTETSDNLSVVLVDADRTKLAEAPFRVNVKPHQVVKLSGDFAGRKLGDELLFETNRDEAVIPGAYYWFVNGQVVNGGCGWFVSNKLQEGDAVKCIVEEEGGCAQRSVSNEVIVRYKGKDHAHDAIKAGEWDNGGFFVPNVITPNNDGLNDTWRLDFIQDYPDHLVTIYDYSGRVVYRTRHYNNDWEGRIDNVITYGVYTCVVDLGNGKNLKTWLLVKNNEAR